MRKYKFREPRIWSNIELKKFSPMFQGSVANISGWKDSDKQGGFYKDYFTKSTEYWITNFRSDARGFQGNIKNEIFLDLSKSLDQKLIRKFDVVFNHTVLEHIFDIFSAFKNICDISKDIVILVVPFMQEQHGDYGDYWRFSPQAIDKLFKINGLATVYINYNDSKRSSIYIFSIGSKNPEIWSAISNHPDNKIKDIYSFNLGNKIIGDNKIENSIIAGKKMIKSIFQFK